MRPPAGAPAVGDPEVAEDYAVSVGMAPTPARIDRQVQLEGDLPPGEPRGEDADPLGDGEPDASDLEEVEVDDDLDFEVAADDDDEDDEGLAEYDDDDFSDEDEADEV